LCGSPTGPPRLWYLLNVANPTAATKPAQPNLTDASRPWRLALCAFGGLWALLTLPLVAGGWGWRWQDQISQTPLYRALAEWAGEPYIVFGGLGAVSFLAIGLALLPDMRRAGLGGRLFAWLIILGAGVTVISYLGTPYDSPLHPLWGAEGYWLILVGLAGIVAAFTAGRAWRPWMRVVLGLSLPVLAAGTLALQYYPHGSLVALAIEAVVLIAAAPRAALRTPGW